MGLHCTMWETVKKTKRQPTEWGNIFANDMLNTKNISNLIEK